MERCSQWQLVQRRPLSGDQDGTSRVSRLERWNRSGTDAGKRANHTTPHRPSGPACMSWPKNENSSINSQYFLWPYFVPGILISFSREPINLFLTTTCEVDTIIIAIGQMRQVSSGERNLTL